MSSAERDGSMFEATNWHLVLFREDHAVITTLPLHCTRWRAQCVAEEMLIALPKGAHWALAKKA